MKIPSAPLQLACPNYCLRGYSVADIYTLFCSYMMSKIDLLQAQYVYPVQKLINSQTKLAASSLRLFTKKKPDGHV